MNRFCDRGRLPRAPCVLAAAGMCCVVGTSTALAQGGGNQNFEDQLQKNLNLRGAVVVKLDVNNQLATPMQVRVPIGDQVYTLDLSPYSVRSDDYSLWEQQADGTWLQRDPGPINTLRGDVVGVPSSVVAGGLMPEGLHARIMMGDSDYWMEPISGRIPGAEPGMYVIYTHDNLIQGDYRCGNTEMPPRKGIVDIDDQFSDGGNNPRGATLYTAQLACDSDWPYFQRYGGTANVQSRIATIINTMNLQYERDVNIVHSITATLTRSSDAADPYTATDPATLNVQIESEWNGQGAITKDVIQLFTAREIDGNVIGRANHIGSICTAGGDPNCFVQSDFNNNFMSSTDLSAHELGHLWDASHCTCSDPASTMNPFITSINRFTFANDQNNIGDIVAYRNGRTCLTTGGGGNTPRNNTCAEALNVSTGRFGFTNTNANTDGPAVTGCGLGNDIMEDVWYTFRPQCDGTLTIHTCNNANESGFDTVLVLYTGGCTTLTQVACNDDAGDGCATSGLRSRIVYTGGVAQQLYYIRVGGYNGINGNGIISIAYTTCPERPNDTCASATTVTHCDSPVAFNTENADSDGFIEQNDCNFSGSSQIFNDIWYRYIPPCTGTVRLSTCGANFDTKIAVYTSCPTGINSALACNDDNGPQCAGLDASVEFLGISGADYLIRLGSYSQTGYGVGNLVITNLACDPPNDTCGTATDVSTGATAFSTIGACDTSTSSNNCLNDGGQIPRDIWYRWVAPATCAASVTIDTCDATYDSKIAVYNSCPIVNNTALVCNDDACGTSGLRSRVTFTSVPGADYLIRIGGFNNQTGTGTMTIAADIGVPANNACASPQVIGNGTTDVTNCGATQDGPNGSCRQGFNDVWFIYQATCTGNVTVDTCTDSNFDTVLIAYPAAGGCPVVTANEVACNDDACGASGLASRITFPATDGQRFRIRLASFNSLIEGSATLRVSCAGACPCDWNHNGVLNSQDFFDFLAGFFSNPPNADFNNNGVTNSQDFFDFLGCFFAPPAGCS